MGYDRNVIGFRVFSQEPQAMEEIFLRKENILTIGTSVVDVVVTTRPKDVLAIGNLDLLFITLNLPQVWNLREV